MRCAFCRLGFLFAVFVTTSALRFPLCPLHPGPSFKLWQCQSTTYPISVDHVCDGMFHCPLKGDETNCLETDGNVSLVLLPRFKCYANVCYSATMSPAVAHVLCRQLGFSTFGAIFEAPRHLNNVGLFASSLLACNGGERTLQECIAPQPVLSSDCSFLGVSCVNDCTYIISNQTSGNITSPGYPSIVLPNIDCTWIFRPTPGFAYSLKFLSVNLQTEGDLSCKASYIKLVMKAEDGLDSRVYWAPVVCNWLWMLVVGLPFDCMRPFVLAANAYWHEALFSTGLRTQFSACEEDGFKLFPVSAFANSVPYSAKLTLFNPFTAAKTGSGFLLNFYVGPIPIEVKGDKGFMLAYKLIPAVPMLNNFSVNLLLNNVSHSGGDESDDSSLLYTVLPALGATVGFFIAAFLVLLVVVWFRKRRTLLRRRQLRNFNARALRQNFYNPRARPVARGDFVRWIRNKMNHELNAVPVRCPRCFKVVESEESACPHMRKVIEWYLNVSGQPPSVPLHTLFPEHWQNFVKDDWISHSNVSMNSSAAHEELRLSQLNITQTVPSLGQEYHRSGASATQDRDRRLFTNNNNEKLVLFARDNQFLSVDDTITRLSTKRHTSTSPSSAGLQTPKASLSTTSMCAPLEVPPTRRRILISTGSWSADLFVDDTSTPSNSKWDRRRTVSADVLNHEAVQDQNSTMPRFNTTPMIVIHPGSVREAHNLRVEASEASSAFRRRPRKSSAESSFNSTTGDLRFGGSLSPIPNSGPLGSFLDRDSDSDSSNTSSGSRLPSLMTNVL